MDVQNNPLYLIFMQIDDVIRYRTGSIPTGDKEKGTKTDPVNTEIQIREYTCFGKRKYGFLLNKGDRHISLAIKEDGGTRTVFNGRIYSLQNFIYIDMLTQ